jgi:N-acetylmuramic acid 6-phosphate etherase
MNALTVPGMIDWLYTPGRAVSEIAALAGEVAVTAAGGDVVATRLLVRAADALAAAAVAASRRLDFEGEPFPLVMSGGVFDGSALLRGCFADTVQSAVPAAQPVRAERDAVYGAAVMALEMLQLSPAETSALRPPPEAPRRATERRNRLTAGLHRRSAAEIAALMNIEDARIAPIISEALPAIGRLIEALAERYRRGGRLIYVGAGTSGRLAVLDAAECLPTFSIGPERIEAILAGGNRAMFEAVEGAEDDTLGGHVEIAAREVGPRDTVIGVAASGSTPFVRGALDEARQRGALTGCIVCVSDAPMAALVEHAIVLPTGPEVLAGSTRLKAGTAQKLALNMISTALMARVGRVYSNLMTDMQANNAKLRERAVQIVAAAAEVELDSARVALAQAGGEMKTAIAMLRLSLSAEAARRRLAAAENDLGRVVDS